MGTSKHAHVLMAFQTGANNRLPLAMFRRKRIHDADEIMAEIVAKRLGEHLERSGFVVMKRPAEIGAAALGQGLES